MLIMNVTIAASNREGLEEAINRITHLSTVVKASKAKQPSNSIVSNYSYEYEIIEKEE